MKYQSPIKKQTQDALTLLISEHKQVKSMFQKFESLNGNAREDKKKIADAICHMLTAHSQIKEEIFYPQVGKVISENSLMDEAKTELASAKDLIAQIKAMNADDHLYDEKVKVLSEQVNQHIREEQSELFPKVRQANIDLFELGEEMIERKEKIQAVFLERSSLAFNVY